MIQGDIVKVKGVIQTTQISRLSTDFDPARPELAKYEVLISFI